MLLRIGANAARIDHTTKNFLLVQKVTLFVHSGPCCFLPLPLSPHIACREPRCEKPLAQDFHEKILPHINKISEKDLENVRFNNTKWISLLFDLLGAFNMLIHIANHQ